MTEQAQGWEDDLRLRRRRRAGLLALAVLLVGVASVSFNWLRSGSDEPRLGVVAGGPTGGRTLDTSVFVPPSAATNGPTTTPGGPFRLPGDPAAPTTLPTTTTAPPAPTTTIAPLPAPGEDPVCQAAVSLGSALTVAGIGSDDPTVPEGLSETFRGAADLVAGTGEAAYEPIVGLLRSIADELGGTTSPERLETLVTPLIAPSDPAIGTALQAFLAHTQAACPGLDRGVA